MSKDAAVSEDMFHITSFATKVYFTQRFLLLLKIPACHWISSVNSLVSSFCLKCVSIQSFKCKVKQ